MPTSASYSYVKPSGLVPAHAAELAIPLSVRLKASTTYKQGALLGEVAASPGTFGPYSHTATDGCNRIKAILKRACKTDSDGKIYFGDTNPGEDGILHETAEVYVSGIFHSEDIPTSGSGAMDSSNAVGDGLGKVIYGNLTTGAFWLGLSLTQRQIIDMWYQDNVTASQSAVALTRNTGPDLGDVWVAPRAGSLVGIFVKSSAARTAGTLTILVKKNGSAWSTISAVLDATNTTYKFTGQDEGVDTFAAGDQLLMTVTTDSGWLPTTADIIASFDVVM